MQTILAIEITDSEIYALAAKRQNNKLRIRTADKCKLPPGCIADGVILDSAPIAEEITAIRKKNQLRGKRAILVVNTGKALYKQVVIPIPKVKSEAVIAGLILHEMGLTEAYSVSYQIVDIIRQYGQSMMKISAAACPKECIDGYITLCRAAKLIPISIQLGSDGISRYIKSGMQTDEKTVLLLNMSNHRLQHALYVQGILVSSRFVFISPADFAHHPDYLQMAVYDHVFHVVQFARQQENKEIDALLYYGDLARADAVLQALTHFQLPQSALPPLSGIEWNAEFGAFTDYAPVAAACLPVQKKTARINLLHHAAYYKRKAAKRFFVGYAAAAVLSLACITGLWLYCSVILDLRQEQLVYTDKTYAHLAEKNLPLQLEQMEAAVSQFHHYTDAVQEAESLYLLQPVLLPRLIEQLTEAMPDGMTVSGEVLVIGHEITAQYTCTDSAQPAAYVARLNEQGVVEQIVYTGYTRRDSGDFWFSLTMQIKGGNRFDAENE